MAIADDINWSEWHRIEQKHQGPAPAGPAVSVTARQKTLLVAFNGSAAAEFGLERGQLCDVFEGQGSKAGWLLVRKNPKGAFTIGGGIKGSVRLCRFRPAWLPEFPQPKAFCRAEKLGASAVAIELPSWFDRSLHAEELAAA